MVAQRIDVDADAPDVLASQPPLRGYTAYQVALQYSGILTLQQQDGLAENRAPTCATGWEEKIAPVQDGPARYVLACKVGPPLTTYNGVLANIQFVCPRDDAEAQIDLIGGAGAKVSAYVSPSITGSMQFLKSVGKDGKSVADAVLIRCGDPQPTPTPTPTTPEDGVVLDAQCSGWTLYDVWTRGPSPSGWVRDKTVSIADLLAVVRRFGANDHGGADPVNRNSDPWSLPVADTGYHPAYDRGPSLKLSPWDLAPPDGAITMMNDILGVARQLGFSCR